MANSSSVCYLLSYKMKIVLLLIVVVSCYAMPVPDEWENYKTQFNKSYSDAAEDQMRKEIFLKNHDLVEKHNQKYKDGLATYTLGLNKFSDYTEEEMKKLHGYRPLSS